MKIQITKRQAEQFNRMAKTLRKISKMYQNIDQIKRNSGKDWGLDYEEALEMAYENMQQDAHTGVKGVAEIKIPAPEVKSNTPN